MAKGNDGNLLQHACELAALRALIAHTKQPTFALYCTHSMEPFSGFPVGALTGPGSAQLALAFRRMSLLSAGRPFKSSPLVLAFSNIGVSISQYPNSAILLRDEALRQGVGLRLVLAEKKPSIAAQLTAAFPPPDQVESKSWRKALGSFPAPQSPWVFTMDPYTFTAGKGASKVNARDLSSVSAWLQLNAISQHGIACVFCYKMSRSTRQAFRTAVRGAFSGWQVRFIAVSQPGRLLHVAALISMNGGLLDAVMAEARLSLQLTHPFV